MAWPSSPINSALKNFLQGMSPDPLALHGVCSAHSLVKSLEESWTTWNLTQVAQHANCKFYESHTLMRSAKPLLLYELMLTKIDDFKSCNEFKLNQQNLLMYIKVFNYQRKESFLSARIVFYHDISYSTFIWMQVKTQHQVISINKGFITMSTVFIIDATTIQTQYDHPSHGPQPYHYAWQPFSLQ